VKTKVTSLLFSAFLLSSITVFAQPEVIRIACVGNSITQGTSDANAYPQKMGTLLGSHYQSKNFGVGGRTLLKKGDYPYWNEQSFWDAQDFNPHIVIIKLGTNDSKPQNWKYGSEFFSDYMELVNVFRKNGRNPQIFVCRPVPVFQDNFGITASIVDNEIIPLIDSVRATAKTDLIDFYACMTGHGDMFADGIHPSIAGYALMAEFAKNAVLNSNSGIIRYLNSRSSTYEKGQIQKIFWETTPGSNVTINGIPVADADSLELAPDENGIYTLITNGIVKDTVQLHLTYLPSGTIKSFQAKPTFLDLGKGDTTVLTWSSANGSTVTLDGVPVAQSGTLTVVPASTTIYKLETTGDISESREVTVNVLPSDQINRALKTPTKASKTRRGSSPDYAVDGDPETAWLSAAGSGVWMYVDLGKTHTINRVVINWGDAFAKTYSLQSLSESGAQKSIFSTTTGDGGTDDLTVNGVGRYFRILNVVGSLPDSGYWIKEYELYGYKGTGVGVESEKLTPVGFSLEPNYPNPFNPETKIRYSLPVSGEVKISVLNLLGQLVWNSEPEKKPAGSHDLTFSGENLPSGIYVYQVSVNSEKSHQSLSGKMVLVK